MEQTTEQDVLEKLIPELTSEGYEVFLRPDQILLPSFFAGYSPDAIAKRSDKNLAIEIIRRSPESEDRLRRAAKVLEGQRSWELKVYWLEPVSEASSLPVQSAQSVRQHIDEVIELAGEHHIGPSLLMGWATFEALGRALAANRFRRAQTPRRLVEVLAAEGYLTPTEADTLRRVADKRNRLVHGELIVDLSGDELSAFIRVLETLYRQLVS